MAEISAELENELIDIFKNIYKKMGVGYKEAIYQKCVSIELTNRQIFHGNEITIPIYYYDFIVGQQRLDIGIYLDGLLSVIIEFKAQEAKLGNKECIQINRYMKNTKATVGYIVNFKMTIIENDLKNSLEIFKVHNNQFFKFNIEANGFEARRMV